MKPAIEIRGLSKKYNISHQQKANYRSLRDDIVSIIKKPLAFVGKDSNTTEEFWALKNINLDIEQGDVIGIVGKNGSGKSTLLKILSRIVDPTSGEAIMRGKVASLLEVGTGFHPELTGRENIYFNGSILGMPKKEIEQKFDEIVEFAEIERFLDTPVKFYSSGMYVRLAFAVAAHLEPDILIIDEVLAVGDAAFQKKCLGKMNSVASEGRTVIFVSHSMETVRKLCNKGVYLVNGEIAAMGTVQEVTDSYLDAHKSESSVFEVPLPHNADETRGYIQQIEVFNSKKEQISTFGMGHPWSAKVRFKINKEAPNFHIAAGLKNNLDIPVRTSWSDSQDLSPGVYESEIHFDDIILEEGLYNLAVGLASDKRTFAFNENLAFIAIENQGDISERIVQTSGSGIVLTPLSFKTKKVEE